MRKWFTSILLVGFVLFLVQGVLAQVAEDQGNNASRKKNNHNGNKVRSVFYNYGLVGDVPPEISGEWPQGTGNEYVGDVSPLVGAEFVTPEGDTLHSVLTSDGPRGWSDGPPGISNVFWGFEPLPGYADPDQELVAMSTSLDNEGIDGIPGSGDDDGKPDTWPDVWPDQPSWLDDLGIPDWNGYFGRDVFNADQESYFRFDDARDAEFFPAITPTPADTTRKGLGFEVKARGLQWAHFMAEDCIFWLYEIINEGVINYDKVAFGMVVGTLSGGRGDSNDDLAYFELENDITYSWDFDDIGTTGWVPVNDNVNVGYVGYAFLESPGNVFDGIDNDGDALYTSAPEFNSLDFMPRPLNQGDQIVRIVPRTVTHPIYGDQIRYDREVITIDSNPFTFTTMEREVTLNLPATVGESIDPDILEENELDNFDNDFDGLIDENFEAHFDQRVNPPPESGASSKPALRHVDYFTGAGLDDPMIDEGRFDGIDNDGDWDITKDDVGRDGQLGSLVDDGPDEGEGDGIPTPGEPHFDEKDVDESDQIGLTSFDYFTPPGAVRMNNDPQLWDRLQPGFFDVIPGVAEDGDFVYGSGLFPVPAGGTQWFSFSLVYGEDFNDILNNKITVQTIYDENYNFARPPEKPRLTAVPGDGRVTLYWDSAAEASYDPVSGYDFEGYKIYRSTEPNFNEINTITDGYGRKLFYEPLAVFDKYDEYEGFFDIDFNGAQYYLGENNGLRHSYIDSTVTNGVTYYYGVTAYDHGKVLMDTLDLGNDLEIIEKPIYPAETTKSILRDQSGNIILDLNTAYVTPNDQVAGYQAPTGAGTLAHVEGRATGDVYLTLLDEFVIPDKTYEVTFQDTTWFQRQTLSYSVMDITDPANPDTIIFEDPQLIGEGTIFDGMRLTFRNDSRLLLNTDPEVSHWRNTTLNFAGNSRYWIRNADGDTLPTFSITKLECNELAGETDGIETAFDYQVIIYDEPDPNHLSIPLNTVCNNWPLVIAQEQLNFDVLNLNTNQYIDVAFSDYDGNNKLSYNDEVYFLESNPDTGEELVLTWRLALRGSSPSSLIVPTGTDTLDLVTFTPFNRDDVYRFTTQSAKIDEISESELDNIKVVPNPYVAVAKWEENDPFRSGRGDRRIDFIHVPVNSTIRIYTVRGDLVQTLKHDGNQFDGTVSWNLRTKDGLDAAYGVYIYHVDAPGIGEHIDKFAIIK